MEAENKEIMEKIQALAEAFLQAEEPWTCPECGGALTMPARNLLFGGLYCPGCRRSFTWREAALMHSESTVPRDLYPSQEQDMLTLLDEIRADAFAGCGSGTLVVPENIRLIHPFAFRDSGFEEILLPQGLTRIEEGTFKNCARLTRVVLPEGLQVIGSEAFAGCEKLEEVTIPESVQIIDDGAFQNTGLKRLTLKNTQVVGHLAFFRCEGLEEITLENVRYLYSHAFAHCTGLRRADLGAGLLTVGEKAFYGCTALPSLRLPHTLCELGNQAFAAAPQLGLLFPKALEEHVRNFRLYLPPFTPEENYLYEEAAAVVFYEGV